MVSGQSILWVLTFYNFVSPPKHYLGQVTKYIFNLRSSIISSKSIFVNLTSFGGKNPQNFKYLFSIVHVVSCHWKKKTKMFYLICGIFLSILQCDRTPMVFLFLCIWVARMLNTALHQLPYLSSDKGFFPF